VESVSATPSGLLLLLKRSTGLANLRAAGSTSQPQGYRLQMPWIETSHEDEWEGAMAALRDEVVDPATGRVDWIMRVHSLDPGSLRAHHVLYRQAMTGTATLRKVDREMIALVVSRVNGCDY